MQGVRLILQNLISKYNISFLVPVHLEPAIRRSFFRSANARKSAEGREEGKRTPDIII